MRNRFRFTLTKEQTPSPGSSGLNHLYNAIINGDNNAMGFDDLIEKSGRVVNTASIISSGYQYATAFSADPLDCAYEGAALPLVSRSMDGQKP